MNNELPKPSDFITLEDYLNWASEYFVENDLYYGHGTDNAWDEAVMLALFVLQLPAENDVSVLQQKLKPAEQQKLYDLALLRVSKRLPAPYLTNEAWFAGERYYVNEHVLIPRSPIAETIMHEFQPWLGDIKPQRILDLCTGSGCLAILCAKYFPDCIVDAVDISKEALQVAKKNILLHDCVERVNPIKSDLFANLQNNKYDIIISNPPYIGEEEMAGLPLEYTHEPVLALQSGIDGLDLTILILKQAAQFLTDKGLLIVEVGNSWHALEQKYPDIPFTWLEFSQGGDGVFLLTAEQLKSIKL